MKKLFVFVTLFLIFGLFSTASVFASVGQMGFFGGITEGTKLPKTTEQLLATTKKTTTTTVPYKEIVFLGGVPVEFSGTMTVKDANNITDDVDSGEYTVNYLIRSAAAAGETNINRNLTFTVRWYRKGTQIVKDYTTKSWAETISGGGATLTLNPALSHFDVSVLEDHTPGVVYAKGDISQRAVYGTGDDQVVYDLSGSLYAYNSAWSNTETHRLNGSVYAKNWSMQYQVRPSVSVQKTLQYSPNEPQAISFEGNYRELMSNKSGLQYNIYVKPQTMLNVPDSGGATITSYNTFEQLPAPDLNFLKGNAAEWDIKRLFSMGILTGETKFYIPGQAVTRGQYVTMLVNAIKLPIEPAPKTTGNKKAAVPVIFPDVTPERSDYPQIIAAYRAGLAVGRGNGQFYVDYSIQREEALVILLRTLGLSNLGLDSTPMAPFADDAKIADWARREIYAAYKIGLISPDEDGNINPKTYVSKAEAAALVNRLLEYMRSGLAEDYAEAIVNYAN